MLKKSRSARPAEIIRRPVAAGIFYPGERAELKNALDQLMGAPVGKEKAVAVIAPHGAVRWAGPVMAAAYSAVRGSGTAVVAGSNHSGAGARFGLGVRGGWETPLGVLPLEGRLARKLLQRVPELERDEAGLREEHAIEIQLPFLQRVGISGFVPLSIGPCDAVTAERIGEGVARAVAESAPGALLVATMNLSRYVPPELVMESDRVVTEAILALDGEALLQAVVERGLTLCGAEATAVILTAAKRLGVRRAVRVGYQVHRDTVSAVSAGAFILLG